MVAALSLLAGFAFFAGENPRVIPPPRPEIVAARNGEFAVARARLPDAPKHPTQRMRLRLLGAAEGANLRPLWTTTTDFWPRKVVVSDDARVAALDEWPGGSDRHAVTIYDDAGRILANHRRESFMTATEIEGISGSWMEEAHFESYETPFRLRLTPQPEERRIAGFGPIRSNRRTALAVRLYNDRLVWFDPLTGKPVAIREE